jgi:type II restriction/modification system DNA methylase subunit YeeA
VYGRGEGPTRGRAPKLSLTEKLVREWEREDEEFRELRRLSADWKFIEEQPPHIRAALLYFIEKGDRYVAARIAGLTVDEFDELRRRANIPVVV